MFIKLFMYLFRYHFFFPLYLMLKQSI
jgi:hypothetical protein